MPPRAATNFGERTRAQRLAKGKARAAARSTADRHESLTPSIVGIDSPGGEGAIDDGIVSIADGSDEDGDEGFGSLVQPTPSQVRKMKTIQSLLSDSEAEDNDPGEGPSSSQGTQQADANARVQANREKNQRMIDHFIFTTKLSDASKVAYTPYVKRFKAFCRRKGESIIVDRSRYLRCG